MKSLVKEFTKGIAVENPIFGMVLGLCPALAISTSVTNAVGMGLAATFVLVCSNSIIASLRNLIPARVRLPAYIVIIATFVSICEMVLKAYLPALDASLGIYVPLIVVNCIIMARAEAFASRNPVIHSAVDGLGMGAGFTLAIIVVSVVREILGSGSLAGKTLLPGFEPAGVLVLAPGALLTLGMIIAFINFMKVRLKKERI